MNGKYSSGDFRLFSVFKNWSSLQRCNGSSWFWGERRMSERRPEVLLHEPLWKIPSQTTDSMENGFADFEDSHGHYTGNDIISSFVFYSYPKFKLFFHVLPLDFVLKRPHIHVHKPLKLCWLWRADGRLKFSLDDDFVLVRDFEIISHGLCKYR